MGEFKSEMEITVWERKCWVCGKNGYVTSHHTLPKHLKPLRNFVCPVCPGCHEKINQSDIRGLTKFAVKIQRTYEELKDTLVAVSKKLSRGD